MKHFSFYNTFCIAYLKTIKRKEIWIYHYYWTDSYHDSVQCILQIKYRIHVQTRIILLNSSTIYSMSKKDNIYLMITDTIKCEAKSVLLNFTSHCLLLLDIPQAPPAYITGRLNSILYHPSNKLPGIYNKPNIIIYLPIWCVVGELKY